MVEMIEEFVSGLFALAQVEGMQRLAEPDLPLSQGRILFITGTAVEPLPIHVIAEQLGISLAATGRNIDRMVKLGLLSRRESSLDRRVKLIEVTERGRELITALDVSRRAAITGFLERLPDPERAALRAALGGVLDSGALYPSSATTISGASL